MLRGLLFPESHSFRLFEYIEISIGSIGIISPHIRNTAIKVLEDNYPLLLERFYSNLISLIKRKVLEVVPDGSRKDLPPDVCYDPKDDDIVLATAIKSKCNLLATLDKELAYVASKIIEVLPPSQPECNMLIPISQNLDNVKNYAGQYEGSIIMQIRAKKNSTRYYHKKGRRYIFCSSNKFGCWLNEKNWRFEIGYTYNSDPIFPFKVNINPEKNFLIAISYDCLKNNLHVGIKEDENNILYTTRVKNPKLPSSFGDHLSILGNNGQECWEGYWHGILSTAKFIGDKAMKYALQNKSHFEPLDCQRYKLVNKLMEPALLIIPNK